MLFTHIDILIYFMIRRFFIFNSNATVLVPYLVNGGRGMGSLASRLRGRCPPRSPTVPPGPPGESRQSCGRRELELADLLYRSREPFNELIVAWIFISCRKRHTSCFCISICKVYIQILHSIDGSKEGPGDIPLSPMNILPCSIKS